MATINASPSRLTSGKHKKGSSMASQKKEVVQVVREDSMDNSSMNLDVSAQKAAMEKRLGGVTWTQKKQVLKQF